MLLLSHLQYGMKGSRKRHEWRLRRVLDETRNEKEEETRETFAERRNLIFNVENWWRLTVGRNTNLDSDEDSK